MIDFKGAAAAILPRAAELVPQWLGGGRIVGHEYVCADIHGGKGSSFSVNLTTGQWADFASPECKGGDLISLYAEINQLTQLEAAQHLGLDDQKSRTNGAALPVHADPPMQTPPQVDFQPSLFKHHKYGTPAQFWIYYDAAHLPICAVARYNPDGERKQIMPWIYAGDRWRAKAPPRPRPLYGLDRLAK